MIPKSASPFGIRSLQQVPCPVSGALGKQPSLSPSRSMPPLISSFLGLASLVPVDGQLNQTVDQFTVAEPGSFPEFGEHTD